MDVGTHGDVPEHRKLAQLRLTAPGGYLEGRKMVRERQGCAEAEIIMVGSTMYKGKGEGAENLSSRCRGTTLRLSRGPPETVSWS